MIIQSGTAVCISLCIVFYALRRLRRYHLALPEGPKGSWIVGNLTDFLSDYQWKKFAAWSKIFGDIIYMDVLGNPVVVLNKYEHAKELMDKRGAIYSDRPRMVYINDMLNLRSPTFMPYGDDWRAYRRLMQQYLNIRSVVALRPLQVRCVHELLYDLLIDPAAFWKHVKRFAASAILSATYGYTVEREDDPLIKLNTLSDRAVVKFGPPGATLVDFIPALRYIPSFVPGASFKKVAGQARDTLREMATRPYDMVKEQRAAGVVVPSLLSRMLDAAERQGGGESHYVAIKDVCGSMYRAGVATTSTALYVFILAMVLHPNVAEKCQKELDTVLGNRLPDFDDQDSLPYVTSIMKECLRWAPPFPLGIAHRVMKEDELEGKRIPRGSTIMPNIWQMMHDERNYQEPERFNPERFMNSGESQILDPATVVFGFGRRICPGRHFAEADLWLAIASILTVFNILPMVDENGSEIVPGIEFTPGFSSLPKGFPCRFVPRTEKAATLVKTVVKA